MQIVIYDIETLLECFLVGTYIPGEGYRSFRLTKWNNELDGFINFLNSHSDYYFVGYNNIGFDAQVIEWIYRNYESWHNLENLEICKIISQKAQDIIHDRNYNVFPEYRESDFSFKQIDLFKINHYDNKNRMVSLKRLEFEMDLENIEEMPIHHLKENMSKEDIEETDSYCKNDVIATYEFYKVTTGQTEHPLYKENDQLELRKNIEEEFGISCLNYSDSKIGDEIIKKYYCEEKGIKYQELPKKGTFRKYIAVKNCIAPYVTFRTKELNAFLKRIRQINLGMKDDFKEKIVFYGNTYSFMKGGLHSENRPEIFEADNEYEIIDWDVSSMYPATIINNGRYPAHLGKEFLSGYKKMFEKRLHLKPLAKNDKKIAGIVGALKLAVNSAYGKTSDMQSWLYDRLVTMFTTITGELSLMMLIEKYELSGIHVISANTDGVTVKIKKTHIDKMHEINKWWCETTQYELERTDYSKIIFSTVNDYLAIKTDGKLKFKGDFLIDFELHKNKSAKIVPIALKKYFVDGIPVEETIKNHKNIYDFAIRQKASKDFHYEGVILNIGEPNNKYIQEKIKSEWKETDNFWKNNNYEEDFSYDEMIKQIITEWKRLSGKTNVYHKLIRYYVSNTGEKIFKIKNPECDTNAAPISQVEAGDWLCTVCNYLSKDHSLHNINYSYYIEKANKLIEKILTNGVKRKINTNPNQLSFDF